MICVSCERPILPAPFGYRIHKRYKEAAHGECIRRMADYGDRLGKEWTFSPTVYVCDAQGERIEEAG